jgi:hypothetical protein
VRKALPLVKWPLMRREKAVHGGVMHGFGVGLRCVKLNKQS